MKISTARSVKPTQAKMHDATMTKIDGMETLLHAFENKLKATTEIAEEAQKTGIDLEEKIRNQMEPQQAGTTPVT